jgi:D-3-phosphoglycerate dehydrogenase
MANIGTQLSVLAENLGMAVFFYDTADRLALGECAPLRHA